MSEKQPPSHWSGIERPHRVLFSDIVASAKRGAFFGRPWTGFDLKVLALLLVVHAGALAAPFHFTWRAPPPPSPAPRRGACAAPLAAC